MELDVWKEKVEERFPIHFFLTTGISMLASSGVNMLSMLQVHQINEVHRDPPDVVSLLYPASLCVSITTNMLCSNDYSDIKDD